MAFRLGYCGVLEPKNFSSAGRNISRAMTIAETGYPGTPRNGFPSTFPRTAGFPGMDEKLARESYDVVVNAFSPDGRMPLDGVDILLQIEKEAKQIPPTVTAQMVVDSSLVDETLKELGSR